MRSLPAHLPRVDQRIEPAGTHRPTPECGKPRTVCEGEDVSARDLARFGEMLRRGRKVQPPTRAERRSFADMTRGSNREKFKALGMSFRSDYI